MSCLKRKEANICENCGTQTRWSLFFTAYEEIVNWNSSFYSVSQFLNNSTVLPPFNSLVFSNERCNLTALSVDNSQVFLNFQPLLKTGIYSPASKELQSTFQPIFTPDIYPIFFVAYFEWPDSATLNGKNTYCTNFELSGSSRSVTIYIWKRLPVTG